MAELKDRAREPESIPLPEPVAGKEGVAFFQEPYFSVLEKEKALNKAAFESSRRNARVERIKAIQIIRKSKVVVYYSVDTLSGKHAELLADLLQSVGRQKRLDLFLLSPGGFADPAFKMATLCRDFAEENFAVIIPHYAKSAATLLSLGSDELIMGSPSEIGPIDPRIVIRDEYGRKMNVSATSVEEALRVIERHAANDPLRSFKYMPLLERINLNTLGESQRALRSSEQFAKELLRSGGLLADKKRVESIAKTLTRDYYSHNHPIKGNVAKSELGFNVTEARGKLWEATWQLHKLYDELIRDSRDGATMITTIFEAEEFLLAMRRPLVLEEERDGEESTGES